MNKLSKTTVLIISLTVFAAIVFFCGGTNTKALSETRIWENDPIEIINMQSREDNPWGFNAGIIEENGAEYIFLTPNTAVILAADFADNIQMEASIHPWMRDTSDGADITVSYMDDAKNIMFQEKMDISSEDIWYVINLNPEHNEGIEYLQLSCGNGEKDDDSGDWVIIRESIPQINSSFGKDGYVRSATYFGKEWPLNFWNSELDSLQSDLKQIKDDGFDSIIIVIPWREFQPDIDPISYNGYAFDQLDRIFRAAQENSLDVYARLSYTWDFYHDETDYIFNRFFALLNDSPAYHAWIDYIRHMNSILCEYPNFKGAFLTWEDYWSIFNVCDIQEEEIRVDYADSMGYQKWVKTSYTLEEYNYLYGTNYNDYDQVPIPQRKDPAMECMYDYFDQYLISLLTDAQDVFPNLSLEVRLDADLVYDKEGNPHYYNHQKTYNCANADFISLMYSIPMGFENVGERVTADTALRYTTYILNGFQSYTRGKPVYIEQFLFFDNTPKFAQNARLIEEEVDDYLQGVVQVLSDYSAGYGIWTYRNYYSNMIYNNGFFLDGNGWEFTDTVEFEIINGSKTTHLADKAEISQKIPMIRNHFDSDKFTVSFDVIKCNEPGIISIAMGEEETSLTIEKEGSYSCCFNKNTSFDFSLRAESGNYHIDNIRMYSFEQEGFLYDPDNHELQFAESVRTLNHEMRNK